MTIRAESKYQSHVDVDLQVLEMNKNHFAQSLETLQNQHSTELAKVAEERAKSAEEIKGVHEKALGEVQEEMKRLKMDLEVSLYHFTVSR